VGSAYGPPDTHESADADADTYRDVVNGDSNRNLYCRAYGKHADASAHYDAHSDEDTRPDRNAEGHLGYAEGNPDDGGDQDSDDRRYVHAYEYPCGDQDSHESADASGNNHAGSDAHADGDAHTDSDAHSDAHSCTANSYRYARAADGNADARSANADRNADEHSDEHADAHAHADVDEHAYCDSD
jgi:hypothetical protein